MRTGTRARTAGTGIGRTGPGTVPVCCSVTAHSGVARPGMEEVAVGTRKKTMHQNKTTCNF